MTHRGDHVYFRSKFAARLLPIFPDSASTAENVITTCGNARRTSSTWQTYSIQSWVNCRVEATLSLWPPANAVHGTRAVTAASLLHQAPLWFLALRTPASETDIRIDSVTRVIFDSRLLLPSSSAPRQNALSTTAMVPANQNMRYGHTTGGDDPHGRQPGTHRSIP